MRRAFRHSLLIVGLLTVLIGTVPREATAQAFGPVPQTTTIIGDIPRVIERNLSKLAQVVRDQLKQAAALAFKNGYQTFLAQVSLENLLTIATGNPGQKPLFTTNPGAYFNEVATSATLDYLDDVSGSLDGQVISERDQVYSVQRLVRGVVEGTTPQAQCRANCEDSSAGLLGAIASAQEDVEEFRRIAARNPAEPVDCSAYGLATNEPARSCATTVSQVYIRELQTAVDAEIKACVYQKCANVGPGIIISKNPPKIEGTTNDEAFQELYGYFQDAGSPVGQLATLYSASLAAGSDAETAARDTLRTGVGPLLSTVSGEIRVPSDGTSALLVQSILQSTNAESIRTGSVLADAFQVFSKTLISRLRQSLFQNPCGLNLSLCKGPTTTSTIANLLFGTGAPTGLAGAKLQFASIGRVDYRTGDPTRTPIQPEDVLQTMGLIDTQFRAAIQEKLTVEEALDKGLLDGGRTFGFDRNGNEPADGYGYRSLVYLRKYRIVPVGWELAALYNRDIAQNRENLNLRQLTQAYNQCGQGQCSNDAGVSCTPGAPIATQEQQCGTGNTCVTQPLSPYCGLVDPDWVLKAPETFCRRQGAGEEVVTRQFVCDDTNGDGKVNCDATGADVGRWEIQRDADSCSDEQSCIAENDDGSCRAFGYCVEERASFRFDGTSCPAPYATCTTYTGPGGTQASYLASTLDTRNCSAASAGCTWYCAGDPTVSTAEDWPALCSSVNGVPSGNVTNFTAAVATCSASNVGCQQFQRTVAGANLLAGSSAEFYGGVANDGAADQFDPGGTGRGWSAAGGAVTQAVTGDTPTGSTTAMRLSGGGSITATTETGSPLDARTFTFSYAARAEGAACSGGFSVTAGGAPSSGTADYGTTWTRFARSVTAPAGSTATTVSTAITVPGCAVLLDDFKLEEGAAPTAYRDYGADAVNLNGTRTQCPATAVGCQSYQPTAGGPAVPGIVKPADRCPATDVGCRSFVERAVSNGTDASLAVRQSRTLSLVPTSGQTCTAADVGCEEFTNLDTVAAGGEGREYFKQIKLCVKPGASNTRTYYTWTGSDQIGFKLEAFELKRSNVNGAPCSNLAFSGVATADPACVDTAPTQATCTAAEVGVNPDCRDYFDESLNHYYMLESKVIRVTADCHPYRNTLDDASGSTKVYTISPKESLTCGAGAAQCRAYAGSAASNTTRVLSSTFEDGTTTGWTGGTASNTAITVGGRSMRVVGAAYYDLSTLAVNGAAYTVTLWAASDTASGTPLSVRIAPNADGTGGCATCSTAPQTLPAPAAGPTYSWNRYTFGPITFTGTPQGQKLFLTGGGTNAFFVDNVELTAVVDAVYLIRDSFRTCPGNENCAGYRVGGDTVTLKSFSGLCQQQFVGCEALYNTQNSASPFAETPFLRGQTIATVPADTVQTFVNDPRKQCPAADIGCTAYGRPAMNEFGAASSFTTVYLKNQPDTYSTTLCLATELYCQAYSTDTGAAYFKDPGRQVCEYVTPPGLPTGWYRRGTTLPCSTATAGTTTYQDQTLDRCEERVVGGVARFCYRSSPDGTCVPCVARICPGEQNTCTEYLDPSEPAECNPGCAYVEQNGVPVKLDTKCRPTNNPAVGQVGCRGYYQLSKTVSTGDCNGTIDPRLGCKAFNNTSGGTLNLRSTPLP